jgi:hypothetical protein
MARTYNVYEDFKKEMKNISHFFNLEYQEKKFSNEDLVFNLLEQQHDGEKKFDDINPEEKKDILTNCVNILQEQNKNPKKVTNRISVKKDVRPKKNEEDNTQEKNFEKENILGEKIEEDKLNPIHHKKNELSTVGVEKKTNSNVITFFPKNFKQEDSKEEKNNLPIDLLNKKETSPKKQVELEKKGTEDLDHEAIPVLDFVAKTTKEVENKKENTDDTVKLSATVPKKNFAVKEEKLPGGNKKVNAPEVKDGPLEKNIDPEACGERKYFQNGKYVIDGVRISTSAFVKRVNRLGSFEKKIDRGEQIFSKGKPVEGNVAKNKNFKIDGNIDENLLNGCYWPTQLS